MPRPPYRAATVAVAVVLAAVALAGCTASGASTGSDGAGGSTSYVAGDGSVSQLAAGEREAPVELSGTTADGATVDVAAWRGSPVVVNVWYAACAPCRAEAPDLVDTAEAYRPDGVRFVGVNTRDDPAEALAFERTYGIGYPSILDARNGSALLSLRGQVPPQAVPTTLVLDREGRVAARALGRVDGSTLRGLLDDVLAEQPTERT